MLKQLAVKEQTRANFYQHLGEKRHVDEVFNSNEDKDTASQYIDTKRGKSGTEKGSTSST